MSLKEKLRQILVKGGSEKLVAPDKIIRPQIQKFSQTLRDKKDELIANQTYRVLAFGLPILIVIGYGAKKVIKWWKNQNSSFDED